MDAHTHRISSQHFARLLQQDAAHGYVRGSYRFQTLKSGISMHGGTAVAQQDWCSMRLVQPYVSFVLLLSGSADFGINRTRCRIEAGGTGQVILVAVHEESLFCRYLKKGETTVKFTVRGLEHWLGQPENLAAARTLYREPIRNWRLDEATRAAVSGCLQATPQDLAGRLEQEARVMQLLAHLWQDYCRRFPAPADSADDGFRQPENAAFAAELDAAYRSGATQVVALAAALHISERTLQRRLAGYMGITAAEWLRHKQMQYALHCLSTGTERIGEIAYRCGYKHASAFTQAFKQYFRCTPAQWRRVMGQGEI